MTDEEYRAENQRKAQLRAERQAIVRQQRQEENDLEFLSYEDPSLYKAVMDKQAAENAALTASNPVTGFGTLTDGSEVYQSGQSRRDIVDYLAPERGLKRDTIQKFMGGNASRSGGFGVADLLGAGLLDAADGLSFSRDMNKRNDLAIAQLEEQIIAEGVKPYSLEFYRQRNARMPEMETSFDAMLDIGIGGIEAVTLGTSRLITKPVKGFLKNLSAKFASPVTPSPSAGALPTANTVAQQTAREILELRAAGRSNEVTEQMMSAADDPYMYANTPLDMSQEARMARVADQKYDPDLIHGSNMDIDGFDRTTRGTFLTNNPDMADSYVSKEGGQLYPVMVRGGDDFPKVQGGGVNYNQIPASGLPEELQYMNYDTGSMPLNTDFIVRASGQERFPGVKFKDITDRGPNIKQYLGETREDAMARATRASVPSDVVNVNNPKNIRSKFARFDPEFANLRNLSASVLGVIGFSGLAAGIKENQDGGI